MACEGSSGEVEKIAMREQLQKGGIERRLRVLEEGKALGRDWTATVRFFQWRLLQLLKMATQKMEGQEVRERSS